MDGYNNLMQLQNMGQSHMAPVSGYGGYGMIPSNGSPIMGGATHGGFPSPVGGPSVGPIGIRPQPFPVGGYGGGFGGTVQPQPMPHPPGFGGFGGSVQPQPWGGGFNPGGFGGSVQPQPWGGGMAGGGLYGGPEPSPFGGNLNNLMMLQQMGRF